MTLKNNLTINYENIQTYPAHLYKAQYIPLSCLSSLIYGQYTNTAWLYALPSLQCYNNSCACHEIPAARVRVLITRLLMLLRVFTLVIAKTFALRVALFGGPALTIFSMQFIY